MQSCDSQSQWIIYEMLLSLWLSEHCSRGSSKILRARALSLIPNANPIFKYKPDSSPNSKSSNYINTTTMPSHIHNLTQNQALTLTFIVVITVTQNVTMTLSPNVNPSFNSNTCYKP